MSSRAIDNGGNAARRRAKSEGLRCASMDRRASGGRVLSVGGLSDVMESRVFEMKVKKWWWSLEKNNSSLEERLHQSSTKVMGITWKKWMGAVEGNLL